MAKKNDGLTPRQRQSQQIMRDKSAKKKRAAWMRKILLVCGSVLAISSLGGGLWLWKSGTAVALFDSSVNGAYGLTAKAGFAVQSLYLEGRSRTSMADIDRALGIKKGDPILQLSLAQIRGRLEKIESIKMAAVERALPETLHIRIVEREPVAQWQNQGKMALVDDNGVVMNGMDNKTYQNLPLIIGDGAPRHINELMALLASEPDLAKRFSAAIRVSDRRWNIRISNANNTHIEIQLPETNPIDAWKKLAQLQTTQQVLDRDIQVIDLRLEDKMFIKVMPQNHDPKALNARET